MSSWTPTEMWALWIDQPEVFQFALINYPEVADRYIRDAPELFEQFRRTHPHVYYDADVQAKRIAQWEAIPCGSVISTSGNVKRRGDHYRLLFTEKEGCIKMSVPKSTVAIEQDSGGTWSIGWLYEDGDFIPYSCDHTKEEAGHLLVFRLRTSSRKATSAERFPTGAMVGEGSFSS